MMPLEAAKKLASYDPSHADTDGCVHCHHFGHEPDCPVFALPRIVAVLEAATVLVNATPSVTERHIMVPYSEYMALAAALKEPEA